MYCAEHDGPIIISVENMVSLGDPKYKFVITRTKNEIQWP